MKPLCLKMNAFGTFAKETVIDFRTIGTKDVFLITGNTGSGKQPFLMQFHSPFMGKEVAEINAVK